MDFIFTIKLLQEKVGILQHYAEQGRGTDVRKIARKGIKEIREAMKILDSLKKEKV